MSPLKCAIVGVFLILAGLSECFSVEIIPQPHRIVMKNGSFGLSDNTAMIYSTGLSAEAGLFQRQLSEEYSVAIESRDSGKTKKVNSIVLDINPLLGTGEEGYTLIVEKGRIKITGASKRGVFYGLQTLRQLVSQSPLMKGQRRCYAIPCLEIRDSPRFGWRSFMLDVSRHFFDADVIIRLLDEMALLKMNVFHWHLTDDQGWRVPIAKYPKLISVASRRDSSQTAMVTNEKGEKVFSFDSRPHEGFYSYEDINRVLAYAAARHITVIPEIDMPSHNQAAMAAYPWLSTTGVKTSVPTVFYGEPYYRNPAEINIADSAVVNFFKNVLDEIITIFPSDVIHVGGDEVWYNLWAESADIKSFMKIKGFSSYADLQMWFSTEMSIYLAGKGKRMMAWNDVLGGHLDNPDSAHVVTVDFKPTNTSVIGFWRGNKGLVNKALQQGYDIVNGFNEFTYFNSGYKGLPLSKAYEFDPVPSDIAAELHGKILGTSCHLWTEHVPDEKTLYFQLFPRIAASAEVGWTAVAEKDFNRFSRSLQRFERRWDKVGIRYYTE